MPHASAAFATARSRSAPGPAAVEADERVALVDRDRRPVEELLHRQALGGDARRLADLQGSLRRGPLVRARAGQLEQARGRPDADVARERSLDGLGDVLELERGSERARELGEPHQRAEVAGRERGAPLLLDRLDVDTRRAAASDHDRRSCAGGAEPLEDRGRESLRVPVAHHEHGVARAGRQPVERRVHRLDRDSLDIGLAEQPDAVVGGVPARASAHDEDPPPDEALGLGLDGPGVGEQLAEVGRLAPHRGAHDAHWFGAGCERSALISSRPIRLH